MVYAVYRSSTRIIQMSTSRRRVLKRVNSGGSRPSAPVIFTHNSSTWYIRALKFECYTTTAGAAVGLGSTRYLGEVAGDARSPIHDLASKGFARLELGSHCCCRCGTKHEGRAMGSG